VNGTETCFLPATWFDKEVEFTEQRNDEEYEAHDSHGDQVTSYQSPLER